MGDMQLATQPVDIIPTASQVDYERVLIIDREEAFRAQLTEYFSGKQVTVAELTDPEDFLSVLNSFQPCVIFIDALWLVEKNPQFIEEVKEMLGSVMCIVSIGGQCPKSVHDILASQADGFLCKNIYDINLLDHILQTYFCKKRATSQKQYYSRLLEDQIDKLKKSRNQLAQEGRNKLLFIKQLSSNLQLPLNQLIQFAHIGLQRIHRKQTMLVGSYLAEIKLISEELLIYINDLKEISLLKTGESEFNLEEVDLIEFLKAIERQFQPIADSRHVNLSFHINLPNPCVMADYNKLAKVINILLRNAFRYLPAKGVVQVKAYEVEGRIFLVLMDNGPGVPTDQQNRLFNMYDQNQLQGGGMAGFGLSICKELMLGQNGDIWLDTEGKGKGSTFVVTLPIAESILD